ncbi:MAG: RNA polymerase sigma factor [Verrucomicrobia bacterium]|nr:RNA polymerase sigma factor [Verrucomicrobiota bacterium]
MAELDYEHIVTLYHEPLYRFAFSLARTADGAGDLTQETYCRLLTKGGQMRDATKVKSWLFTTLYRIFLAGRRHEVRFPHQEISTIEGNCPALTVDAVDKLDGAIAMEELNGIEETFRVPLVLFYLQQLSYREIAEMLDVPIGTVMSRLFRGKTALRERLAARLAGQAPSNIVPISDGRKLKAK